MPSERFMRLSGEKQTVIWKAAVEEFIAQPYEKVSINKIIKQAGISRGSFYTYFEDKRELLAFILWGTRQQWNQFCLESIEKAGGDYFGLMSMLMDQAIDFCRHNNLFALHKNLIMYPEPIMDSLPKQSDCEREVKCLLLDKIDRTLFEDPSEENIVQVFKLTAMVLVSCLSEFCLHPEQEEKLREDYRRALKILRRGSYRGQKEAGAA